MTGGDAPRVSGQTRALALRVVSGVVAVPILVGISYLGGPAFGALLVVGALLGAWETRGMLRSGGHEPLGALLIGLSGLLPLDAWLFTPDGSRSPTVAPHGAIIVASAVVLSLLALMRRRRLDGALVDWSMSLALALYLGGLLAFYAPLRRLEDGAFWVVTLLVLTWTCDTTAYFVGRAFGRVRLAPSISPKKSVEGAVAGLVGALLVGVLIGALYQRPPLVMGGYGLAIGLATILGDLAESLVKRQTGVKDSGVLVPGHGGILDRMDSLLFCAPTALLYVLALT